MRANQIAVASPLPCLLPQWSLRRSEIQKDKPDLALVALSSMTRIKSPFARRS